MQSHMKHLLDSALVAALNARERVIGLANKTLIAACTMASFRGPQELPWVPDKSNPDGALIPPSDAECVDQAVCRGRLLAEAIRKSW